METFHVLGLPNSQTTGEYSCPFTYKARMFSDMMTRRGHTVYLYSGEEVDVACTEHIPLVTKEEQESWFPGIDLRSNYYSMEYDIGLPYWSKFVTKAVAEVSARHVGGDFICVVGGGACFEPMTYIPNSTVVEFGIGYEGVFAPNRVYESDAWMHYLYGRYGISDGRIQDAVIPNFYRLEDFPRGYEPEDGMPDEYLLYVGRGTARKGLRMASEVAISAGLPLVIAGTGASFIGDGHVRAEGVDLHGDHLILCGPVDADKRNRLMAGALALLAPTEYIEPFGSVVVEAQLCGTPVLASPWGAFSETVLDGVTGYKCCTNKEYVAALGKVHSLWPESIRHAAVARYSFEVVAPKYEKYFSRLREIYHSLAYDD